MALVNNLELENPILVGHSMGCRVVLEANRIAPSVSVGSCSSMAAARARATRLPPKPPRKARSRKWVTRRAEDLFRQMFFQSTPATERLVQRAVRQSAEIWRGLVARAARWDAGTLDAALAEVRARVLVIQTTTRDPQTGKRAPMKVGERSPHVDL